VESSSERAHPLFTHAIVRTPAPNFAEGLTTAELGRPDFGLVIEQHAGYCGALAACGLAVTALDADPRFPDSTFVEDTAVITPLGAILARPGARTRAGEVDAIRSAILAHFPPPLEIVAPGTLDGGDICEAGEHFFIGISERTNEEGARQLATHLAGLGYTSSPVDIRGMRGILHLKSGIAYIGENTLVVIEEMAGEAQFSGYSLLRVGTDETYAANCVRVNDRVLVAEGFPRMTAELAARGFDPQVLDVSEFRKMDGGLSCLSLRVHSSQFAVRSCEPQTVNSEL
jgi:dimethylargininase